MGPGFVTRIITPNTPGGDPVLVGLMPPGTKWGVAAVYSDNTVRNEAGDVLGDAGLSAGAAEYNPAARQANGQPWPVKESDPRDVSSSGGEAAGEKPNTDPLFIAGVLPREQVYDNAADGGWGTPIAAGGTGGPPSSWSRRDDRWVWPDGRITDAQQTVLGHTNNVSAAARELQDRGATPSIAWTGQQVIYSAAPPSPGQIVTTTAPSGASTTVDGTGRVLSSSPPGGTNVQTLASPAAPPPVGWAGTEDAAGSPAPLVYVKPHVDYTTPVLRADGDPNTASSPGSGLGTTTAPVSGVEVIAAPSPSMEGTGSIGVPRWALYLGAAVAAVLLLGRR